MRNFKKIAMTFLVVMVVMAGTLPVSARQGMGQAQGQGLANGTGPMASIYDGVSVTVVGKVAALPAIGDPGLKIDDGAEIITVYGIGSFMVWEALGYEPLTVGEDVSIAAYEVTFIDESTKLIAVAVTVGDQTITLRDEEGRPIWRRGAMGGGGNGSQDGNMGAAGQRLHDGSCLQ